MGEPESSYQGPPGSWDAPEHSVTLAAFMMSETEITNQQFVTFLNAAMADGLIDVAEGTMPPDVGNLLIVGTSSAPAEYAAQALYNLSGTRVMKDHIDDGDGDPFTGVIQPENPLNIAYVGYDASASSGEWFRVKDPRDANDFDWQALTDYYNWSDTSRQADTSVLLNDYGAWPELEDYPNNLPTVEDVQNWPASFVRWYGAKAFALFYEWDLPTEAEWEYAGRGGAAFEFGTDDGQVDLDGTSANWNHTGVNPSQWHVEDVKRGEPNPYGLYNMAGNVWEWVEDWYDAAFYVDATNPVNTTDSGYKVRRGGSWNYHQSTLKNAARAKDEQFKGNDHFGFRVVNRSIGTANESSEVPHEATLEIYPNPSTHTATVRFQSGPDSQPVEIIDLLGRIVLTETSHSTTLVTLDVSRLPAGIYGIRVGSQVRTLVIAR